MEDVSKMNSHELQKNFYDIYKNFFNAHDMVLSGDGILTWWADISHGISALRIKQKLPIKTYYGANFNTSGKVTFGKISQYSSVENAFKQDEFNIFSKDDLEKMTDFLQDFLRTNGASQGIEIDILTEAPRWHGFASVCVMSVLLSFLLHLVTGKLDVKTLANRELPFDHPLFDEIYRLSLHLSNRLSQGKSVGASNFAIMMPENPLPIVYFWKKHTLNTLSDTEADATTPSQKRSADTDIYKDTLLHFLWIHDTPPIKELPLDYGVIFTGLEHTFDEIESMRERTKKSDSRLDAFGASVIRSLPIKSEEQTTILDLLSFNKDESSRKHIDNTNLKIIEWFNYIFKNAYDDSAANECIKNIKSIGMMSFSYQNENKLFFALQYLFNKYKQFEDEEIGVLPFNTGKIGGSLFFVMKHKRSRATLQKVLHHLREDRYIATVDYASWRDGYSSDGIRVEQHITEKLYSDYTKEGNVIFANTLGTSYFGDYNTVVEKEKDGILLDTIGGRIYIGGIKLTSKDIHSQNTTIDMLKILLENMGKEVSNSKLPVSTYSQNKNEILSKVVIPIKKLAKEYFWKDISLVCSGWITNYYLRLDPDEWVRIGIVKKIGN